MTILTPKGYTPARQPSAESAPVSPPEPEAVAPPNDGQRIQLTFPPQVVGINCPNCGTPYPAQVFSIVDVGQDPILKSVLLAGQLNMAICPRCNAAGMLNAPLLYHDPEHEFLGVYVPEQTSAGEQQKVIGQLSRRLMDGLPQEARRGYMLTPKQFLNYQSMMEAVLENEGITREMVEAQRNRLRLIEQTMASAADPQALKILVDENDSQMDDEFFGLLNSVIQSSVASGDQEGVRGLTELQERLIELTTWGEGVQRQRAAIAQLKPETTPDELLEMILAAEDERVVDALVTVARSLITYSFFQQLTNRVEAAQKRGAKAAAKDLAERRDHILQLVEQLDQLEQAVIEQAGQVLSDILASNDIQEAVAERADLIDENFLSVLAANLQQAQQRGAKAAVNRLQEVWDVTIDMIQGAAPPEIRLLNQLLNAEYPQEVRRILAEQRQMLSQDLVDATSRLIEELQEEGNQDIADRLRKIRSQIQLML